MSAALDRLEQYSFEYSSSLSRCFLHELVGMDDAVLALSVNYVAPSVCLLGMEALLPLGSPVRR